MPNCPVPGAEVLGAGMAGMELVPEVMVAPDKETEYPLAALVAIKNSEAAALTWVLLSSPTSIKNELIDEQSLLFIVTATQNIRYGGTSVVTES